jgi:hypothetical protein
MDEKSFIACWLVKCTDFPKTEGEVFSSANWSKIATLEDFDWSSILSRKEKNGNGQRLNRKSGAGE